MMSTNNITLSNAKNTIGGRKAEEAKIETKKKKKVTTYVNSLLLNNNQIRSLEGFPAIIESVLFEPHRLGN
jgi:hypothetical protein